MNCPCCPPFPVFGAFALRILANLLSAVLSAFIVIAILWSLGYVHFETPSRGPLLASVIKRGDETKPSTDVADKKAA